MTCGQTGKGSKRHNNATMWMSLRIRSWDLEGVSYGKKKPSQQLKSFRLSLPSLFPSSAAFALSRRLSLPDHYGNYVRGLCRAQYVHKCLWTLLLSVCVCVSGACVFWLQTNAAGSIFPWTGVINEEAPSSKSYHSQTLCGVTALEVQNGCTNKQNKKRLFFFCKLLHCKSWA